MYILNKIKVLHSYDAVPELFYGWELLKTIRKRESKIQSFQTAFVRGVKRWSRLDHVRKNREL